MWAYFLANYSRYGYMLLGFFIVSKLLLALLFQNYERSVVGVVYAIFKWYGVIDRDLAENTVERFAMRLQNLISIVLYTTAAMLLFMALLFAKQ
ncbi:MAG TPA: hypothetical protein VG738_06195 [Chitinophagaceae bacterium]|nr:hypothetical protein [Chitinophagaceae bacterium]